jgi:hypothetical protein
MVWGFHGDVHEICALLGFYAVYRITTPCQIPKECRICCSFPMTLCFSILPSIKFFEHWCLISGAFDLAFFTVSFDYCHAYSFQCLDLVPLISCMFSLSALHLIQSNAFISLFSVSFITFPFYCVFLTIRRPFLCFPSHLALKGGVLLVFSTWYEHLLCI